jgi:hypothetical protein
MERFFRREMIRTYVKQIIIRATRKWKKQNLNNDEIKIPVHELDVFGISAVCLKFTFAKNIMWQIMQNCFTFPQNTYAQI